MIKESLESGSHAKALAYVRGMTTVMSEYLPEIEKMMAKREQIGKQLKQDAYQAPDLSYFREEELLGEGERKLYRLENYRDEFVDFGKKMSDMEYNVSSDLSRIMVEQEEVQTK